MATRRSPLKTIGLILLFTIDNAASGQNAGFLSNIYKKAAKENRPLILVLDNSKNFDKLNSKTRDSDNSYKSLLYSPKKAYNQAAHKQNSALDIYKDKDGDKLKPFLSALLHNYGQKSSQNRYQSSKKDKDDNSLTKTKLRSQSRSERRERRKKRRERRLRSQPGIRDKLNRREKIHLRTQPERDDRDKRDDRVHIRDLDKHEYRYREDSHRPSRIKNYRDSHERARGDDRRDRIRHDHARYDQVRHDHDRYDRDRHEHDRHDHDRYNHDRHDRDSHEHKRQGHDREDYKIKSYIEKKYRGARDSHEIERDENRDRTLRTSVVKKLLRAADDLNCDAQDECADDCGGSYGSDGKKDECEDVCEEKFDCDDNKEEEIAGEGCDFADSCADSGELSDNPSTRGVPVEDI